MTPTSFTPVKERPALDLMYMHFDHKIGDIRVIGTWLFIGNNDPCLVLVPAHRSLAEVTPCVVPLSSAWKWAEETGNEYEAALLAIDFCPYLGKNQGNNDDIFQIMSVVRSRLDDLIRMPPAPKRPLSITGHMTKSLHGKIVEQRDIWDDV
jgi:hypothetical protein